MDPLVFGIKGEVVAEVLGTIVLLSLFVERALAPIFEWRIVLDTIKDKGIKEPVAFGVSFLVIYFYKFDAMAILFSQESNSWIGYAITAGIVAGGSKGSIALFRDYLGWKSTAQKDYEKAKEARLKAANP
jgi:hypothetical protein